MSGRHRRANLSPLVKKSLECFLGVVVKRCENTGDVTKDLKPANLMWGKVSGDRANRLLLVDALLVPADIAAAQRKRKCWSEVAEVDPLGGVDPLRGHEDEVTRG